jgi:rhamnose transport system substrate-binding protein
MSLAGMVGCGPEAGKGAPGKGTGASGSGSAGAGDGSGGKKLKVGMIPKLDIPYFQACRKGAAEACEELGFKFDYFGGADLKVDEQISRIDDWIGQGYDLITLAPNDPEKIAPAIRRAKDAGLTVITYDADANPAKSGRDAFINQATTESIGKLLVEIMVEGIGKEGKTLIVSSTPEAPNQNAWMKVMKPTLAKDFPKLTLLEDLMPGEDQNRCRELTLQTLSAHPDLKGIWGLTSKALPGAAEAVRQAKRKGKVFVTGLGVPSEVKEYVLDDTIRKFALWNPIDLGYLAVRAGVACRGKGLAAADFGRIKTATLSGTEVILGPPTVYDRSNVAQAPI